MTFRKLHAAILAAALAAPVAVSAQSVSIGDEQLANTLGVDVGMYSSEQLGQLKLLMDQDDGARDDSYGAQVEAILENPMGPAATSATTAADTGAGTVGGAATLVGEEQVTMLFGGEPGSMTRADIDARIAAEEDPDRSRFYRDVLAGNMDITIDDDLGTVTPAKEQLAASIGQDIDPAAYTTNQLAMMYAGDQLRQDSEGINEPLATQ